MKKLSLVMDGFLFLYEVSYLPIIFMEVINLNIREILLGFMNEKAYKPMSIKELSKIFNINKKESRDFEKVLLEMEKDGQIVRNRAGYYGVPERMGLVVGRLQGHARGFGFVIPEEEGMVDIFIPGSAMNGAVHGDKVLAKIVTSEKEGKKCEGEIARILERAQKEVIGIYEDSKNFGFVIPEDKRISKDIFIPKSKRNGAKSGEVVIVEVTEWPESRRKPEGKIT